MYEMIKLEMDGPVARLTLNRPDRANSMTMSMGKELGAAMAEVRAASDVRVMVLTGAGRYFCAGADMAEFERLQSSPPSEVETAVRVFLDAIGAMHRLPIPVIARINGDTYGGGIGLALACDLRIMAVDARMGFTFLRVGLSGADAGVSYFLPRIVGPAQATEILLLGKVVGGETAVQMGLVHRAVSSEELDNVTEKLVGQLAVGPPIATRYTKDGLINSLARSMDEAFDFEAQVQTACMMTADHREGVHAFQEKRKPLFTGE
ncbi:MAG: enoyl-CoA hydratase [Chloroflexi bacterium]|nr:enoyl-CoA hydratase [Chloroflexota bacterium]